MRFTLGFLMLGSLGLLAGCGDKDGGGGGDDATDADNDGFAVEEDCDDEDAGINPGATESCDGVDEDCDETIDEGVAATWYADVDGDGYGDPVDSADACVAPDGYTNNADDCDDTTTDIRPGAIEECDTLDNDCDAAIDEAGGEVLLFADLDLDGFGDALNPQPSCFAEPGKVEDDTDCDDEDPDVYPGAPEVWYDGTDQDCYGGDDYDQDFDGHAWDGAPSSEGGGDDCDDGDAAVNPSVEEICANGIDDNCDGGIAGCELLTGEVSLSDADVMLAGLGYLTYTGYNLAAGDLNGDGNDDLVIGAPGDISGTTATGTTYVFLGPISADGDMSDADASYTGSVGEFSATRHAAGGDGDGDGVEDLLVGAFGGAGGAGLASLIRGDAALSGSLSADATFTGEVYSDLASYGLGWLDDVDGDGTDEVLIGSPQATVSATYDGAAYLLYGPHSGSTPLSDADVTFRGTGLYDYLGFSVNGVGDLDGDGLSDVGVGAPLVALATSGDAGGAAYVFLSEPTWSGTVYNRDADITIRADVAPSQIGYVVNAAGDVNGDGNEDLLVTGNVESTAGYFAGGGFVFYGPISGELTVGDADATLYGEVSNDYAGESAVGDFDFDGDGNSDVAIGALGNAASGTQSGRAYLFYGPVSGVTGLGDADAFINGEDSNDFAGVVTAGDFNNDGLDDLAIGAQAADFGGTYYGGVYLMNGTTPEL